MELIDNNSVYQTIWSRFPFTGFDGLRAFIPYWKMWALKIIGFLEKENVGLVAETGAGKTVLAHLIATARYQRILFLVPEKILARQHRDLLDVISKNGYSTQVLLGNMNPRERKWNDSSFITFATPQTFVNDFNRYRAHMNFDLVIMDEFHHGLGKYDYVKIARLCFALHVRTLSLSASPGGNKKKIDSVARALHIGKYVFVPHPQQKKLRSTLITRVNLDDRLLRVKKTLQPLLQTAAGNLKQRFPSLITNGYHITQKQLESVEAYLKRLYPCKQKYELLFWLAVYQKLKYLLHTAFTGTYSVACSYWNKIQTNTAHSQSARYISAQVVLQQLFHEISAWDDASHPKISALVQKLERYASFERGLIFVNNKQTGTAIKNILAQTPVRVETLYGRTSISKQHALLEKIRVGAIDFIVATSVVEEGVSVPEIGCVINFSMPLTEQSRIQRIGRTGRTFPGTVEYIVLNHPFDQVPFFSTARGARVMKELITGQSSPRFIKRKIRNEETLDLFFD